LSLAEVAVAYLPAGDTDITML